MYQYTPYNQYQNQFNNQYNNQYANQYNNQMYQPRQTQTEDVPFNDIKFVTEDEAKAYIVLPNTKVMLMDRDKSIFYIKSADSLGKSTLEGYKYTKLENNPTEPVSHEIDTKEFVKKEDLNRFITKEDLRNFIKHEDLINFATLDDLSEFDKKLENMQKKIVGNMLKGDNNGK